MCITLISTAHPDYPFILLNNRDEFLNRPTADVDWWKPPHGDVLGGRDLRRAEQGTWLGITKDGRISNLTNFRDEGVEIAKDKSRGALVKAYLTQSFDDDEAFVKHLVDDIGIHNVGGFTLLFGKLRSPKSSRDSGLAAVSNRTTSAEGLIRLAAKPGETTGLSNSHYGDLTWPKVVHGEQLLKQAVRANIDRGDSQDHFVASLLDVLSVDTLPKHKPDEDWNTFTRQLRNSILIPPVGGEPVSSKPADKVAAAEGTGVETPEHSSVKVGEGIYGTQKQTVILVSATGRVTYVERTLYDGRAQHVAEDAGERKFDFDIEGFSG